MTVTYDPKTDIGKVRLYLGDTQTDVGVRPDGRNFTDEEIQIFLDIENGDIYGAVATACETLATEWTSYAVSEREGDVARDAKGVAEGYRKRAADWRGRQNGALAGDMSIGVIDLQTDVQADEDDVTEYV